MKKGKGKTYGHDWLESGRKASEDVKIPNMSPKRLSGYWSFPLVSVWNGVARGRSAPTATLHERHRQRANRANFTNSIILNRSSMQNSFPEREKLEMKIGEDEQPSAEKREEH
tara:strand:- start:1772 stop:2110 length:339 start_codon:yes stop_codon:yes gene_type:complete